MNRWIDLPPYQSLQKRYATLTYPSANSLVICGFEPNTPTDFLSNFALANGFVGPTLEHDYQAAKYPHLPDLAYAILTAPTANAAKQIANKNRDNKRPDWNEISLGLMWRLLCIKFGPANPGLARRLQATGNALIVEGVWWNDHHYGVCYCKRCNGKIGLNHLGLMLMEIRDMLDAGGIPRSKAA